MASWKDGECDHKVKCIACGQELTLAQWNEHVKEAKAFEKEAEKDAKEDAKGK